MMFEYSVLNFVCFVTVYLLIKLAPVSLCTAYYSTVIYVFLTSRIQTPPYKSFHGVFENISGEIVSLNKPIVILCIHNFLL